LAVLFTVALATMLAPLNSTMIAVALPHIADAFGANVAGVSWLVLAYLVAMAGIQPAAGTLGDRLGRRWLVLGGLIAFGMASCAAAVAPTLPLLIAARVLQAVAGALLVPNGIALIREVVPVAERARRFGQIAAAASCAAAVGPPLGGILIGYAGWRVVFAANVLLVVPATLLGWRTLPATRPARDRQPFDLVGAIGLTLLLSLAAGVLMHMPALAGMPLASAGPVMVLLIGTVALFRYELRRPVPAFQPRLFLRRGFAAATAANALSNLTLYVTLLAVPLLLTRQGGWSSAAIGLVLATQSAATFIMAPPGGRLADALGRRWPAVLGLLLAVLGTIPLVLAGGAVAAPSLLIALPLIGGGLGLASASMQTGAVEAVARSETGAAAGLFSTSRYLGSIVGAGILSGLLGSQYGDLSGFHTAFMVVALAGLGAVLASLCLRDWPGADDDGRSATATTGQTRGAP
jgi:EmrB/QacA subfamily drug resistance transporter